MNTIPATPDMIAEIRYPSNPKRNLTKNIRLVTNKHIAFTMPLNVKIKTLSTTFMKLESNELTIEIETDIIKKIANCCPTKNDTAGINRVETNTPINVTIAPLVNTSLLSDSGSKVKRNTASAILTAKIGVKTVIVVVNTSAIPNSDCDKKWVYSGTKIIAANFDPKLPIDNIRVFVINFLALLIVNYRSFLQFFQLTIV
ncbi:hypothetical protein LME02_13860 [Leuconostoc mesenteroides subsp. dextranicum]|nr:hypothetical protein LME02_13860 [Leuconostoc mesenteroides subsp. dextranicum]